MPLLRTKPKLSYSGLSIILSNPSRLDKLNLLSGNGGQMFSDHCLRPEYNIMMCDIRVMEDEGPFLPNTKCILIMGESAMHKWVPESKGNTLNEMRGSLFYIQGIPTICTFSAQEAADFSLYGKSKEKELNNELLSESVLNPDRPENDGEEEGDVKTHGNTKGTNYPFWIRADTRKCKVILQSGVPKSEYPKPTYKVWPSSEEVINILTTTKNKWLYFDIETDYEEQNLQCFAFSFDGCTIYSVPVLDYNYQYSYSSLHYILRALAIAIRDNILVCHNGAGFDFLVLAFKYHIPVNKVYDTLIAQHRCFPDVEKSLGHCTSLWTWEPFHKDQDSRGYRTKEQMMARLQYCGKDVLTMFLVHKGIEKYAKTIPGLQSSIDDAMASIKPYLITTLQGIRYDTVELDKKRAENDRLMMQYLRCVNLLIGDIGMKQVKSVVKNGKAGAMPGSNPQCCQYFHYMLGYDVVGRGKPKKDGSRNPSLAKKSMYKLRLKYENPVIDFCNLYRIVKLETSTPLGFIPWKYCNGQMVNINKFDENRPHNSQDIQECTNP